MNEIKKDGMAYVHVEDDLRSVLACFFNYNISHVPVMLDKKLVGMISKTDVTQYLYRYLEDSVEKPFAHLITDIKAKEVMVQPLVQASIHDSREIILEKLVEHQVSSVILRDEEHIVGILTEKDMLRFFSRSLSKEPSLPEKFGHSLVQWLDDHGIFQVSKFLGDVGI